VKEVFKMLAMKLLSVLVAVIFSLSFVGYGIAGGNQGPGNKHDKDKMEDLEDKLEDMLEDLEEEEEEALEELEDLKEIDVELPEEKLMKEIKGVELD
jgi:hypothetical protein